MFKKKKKIKAEQSAANNIGKNCTWNFKLVFLDPNSYTPLLLEIWMIFFFSENLCIVTDLEILQECLERGQWKKHYIHIYVIHSDTLSHYARQSSLPGAGLCIQEDRLYPVIPRHPLSQLSDGWDSYFAPSQLNTWERTHCWQKSSDRVLTSNSRKAA